jgi:hypothetical protein
MNKQITQLAEQSGLMSKQSTTGAAVYTRAQLQKKRQLEKFAELIVQKCVGIVAERKDRAIDEAWNIDEAMSASMFDIEDYFGVKQ